MKIRHLLLVLYIMIITSTIFVVITFSKYTEVIKPETNFQVGDQLHFAYSRGDLYRNNTLIIGVPSSYEDDGEIISCIETMNVIPGDTIIYYFSITNFDNEKENNVAGMFYTVANGLLSLPIKQSTYDVTCSIFYREVPLDENGNDKILGENETPTTFVQLTDNLELPVTSSKKVKYEFRVTANLAGQIENTVSDDYFGATLHLNLYFNAASKV